MTVTPDTRTGTITLTSENVNFTTVGTNLITRNHLPGDIIFSNGLVLVIQTIVDENVGTLVDPCPADAAGINLPVRIRFQPDGSRVKAESRNLIEKLGNGMLESFAGLDGSGGDKLVKLSGVGIAEEMPARSVIALAATDGVLNGIPMYTGPDGVVMVLKTDLVSGVNYDVQIPDLPSRDAYDNRLTGFSVFVSNIGDGRAAIYSKVSDDSGDWSEPAYITSSVPDVEAGTVSTLPYGDPATVEIVEVTNGYEINFGIPRGQPSTVPGPQGEQGEKGDGLQIDATGTTAERNGYDSEPEGFSYVDTQTGTLYFRETATSGVWSNGVPFGKGDKGDTGDSGALITTTSGVGDGTVGPYTLDAAPIDNNSVWASISGVFQYDWTLDGVEITFSQIIPIGVPWQVQTSGPLPVGTATVANDTINASKIDGTDYAAILSKINANEKPAVAVTDSHIAIFDGTTGKTKDSGKTIANIIPANDSVTNAMLANVATGTIKGRVTASTGDPEDLTGSQALTILKTSGAYAKDNILGTVSQTSGVPTGAIIERGSNANGDFVKFADGTLICTQTLALAAASTASANIWGGPTAASWTYPATFIAAPALAGSSLSTHFLSFESSSSGGTIISWSYVQRTGTLSLKAVAVGRWF